jgi:hypothetical protein
VAALEPILTCYSNGGKVHRFVDSSLRANKT